MNGMSNICVDTAFLIGLYDHSDPYHQQASACFDQYFAQANNHLIVPFPILYETVNTRFVKNRRAMSLLNNDWNRLQSERRLQLLSDITFRDEVIQDCFSELQKPAGRYRALSAVDRVIRKILSDVNVQIAAFVTFNPGDFADVCGKFGRELLA
jgi:predicted nucleic acid-binding protein